MGTPALSIHRFNNRWIGHFVVRPVRGDGNFDRIPVAGILHLGVQFTLACISFAARERKGHAGVAELADAPDLIET